MKKNPLDALSKSVINLQRLIEKHGDERKIKRLLETIKMQCLVEVYTSPIIAKLVSEEEMSGFILYLNERLQPILLSYKEEKCSFKNYLIQMASFRALNYLSKRAKLLKMDFALAQYSFVEEQARNYNSKSSNPAEEVQKRYENEEVINILRYMCIKRPSLQRKIFIYLVGIFPYLSSDVIDNMCKSFNIDIDQTLKIFERIFEKSIKPNSTPIRKKILDRRNKSWSFLLYTENIIEHSSFIGMESDKLEQQANKYRRKNEIANSKLDDLKKNMSYSIIAKELKIPAGTISSTVYFIRNILEGIGLEKRDGVMSLIRQPVKNVVLPRFEPFVEFGLTELKEELLEE